MTPFHPDLENDAGHRIDQNDLIAFHLHELSSAEERAVRRVLDTHPGLLTESLAIAATLRAFPKHEASLPLDAAALDRQWLALRSALPVYAAPSTLAQRSLFSRTPFRWAVPALAASALVAAALIVSRHHNPPATVATSEGHSPNALTSSSTGSVASASPDATNLAPAAPRPRSINPLTNFLSVLNPTNTSGAFTDAARNETPAAGMPASIVPFAPTAPASSTQPASTPSTSVTAVAPPPTSIGPGVSTGRHASPSIHHPHPADFTLAMFGNLPVSNSSSSTSGTGDSAVTQTFSQTATNAVGALASFHQQFSPWVGYRITTTYSRPTFEAASGTSSANGKFSTGSFSVAQRIYEFSGTYNVQGPRYRRLSSYVEAGASLLAFYSTSPYSTSSATVHSLHGAGVFGVGSELALNKHWALHAEYRVQLYKPPAFYVNNNAPTPGNLTLSNNPIFGVTYRFGSTGID